MADLASFFVRLGTTFDGTGLKQAQASFKETGKAADSLSGGLGSIVGMVAGGAAIWKLVEFSKESLQAFGEQEQAERRLELAMQNLGVYTKKAHDENVAFATSQQKLTTFADEHIIALEAQLTTFGLYGEQLHKVATGAMDLAIGKQIDLTTAGNMLGKAFQGTTSRLEQMGIKITDTGNVAKNFEQVMAIVQGKFGGAAAAETETYLGKIKTLTNNFGELKERIGKELMPVAEAWLSWTNRAIDAAMGLEEKDGQALKGRQLTIRALREEADAIAMRLAPMKKYQTEEALAQDAGYQKDKARLELIFKRIKAEEELQAKTEAREKEGSTKPNKKPHTFTDEEEKSREKTIKDNGRVRGRGRRPQRARQGTQD